MTAKTPAKVHLRLRFQNLGKPRTAGLCGRAAGACDCGPLSCTVLKSNGLCHSKNLPVKFGFSPKCYRHNAVPNHFSSRFSTSHTNGPRSLSRVKAGTPSASLKESHTTSHTAKQGRFRWGRYYYPQIVLRGSETLRGRVSERQVLPLWGLGRVLPKNAESLRNSDALMRVAVPRRRGPAGLRKSCCRCSFNMIWRDRKT